MTAAWEEAYADHLDFERAFSLLCEVETLQAAIYRGRIRSIQLRLDEAEEHFDKAELLAREAEETIPNLLYEFVLEVFRLDNLLLEAPIEGPLDFPPVILPAMPQVVLDRFPELRLALSLRRHAEAILKLHCGEAKEAVVLWEELVADDPSGAPKRLFPYYAGLAAGYYNLGEMGSALRHIENVELAVLSCDRALYRAHGSAALHALHTFLGNREQAEEWKQFLLRLTCPPESKDVFLERSRRMIERCMHCNAAVIL